MRNTGYIPAGLLLLLLSFLAPAQSLIIRSGGRVTVNGNLGLIGDCGSPVTDSRDGKSYPTVQIGTQCWLAKDLNIGTRINGATSQTNNSAIEKYCYNDLESNCDIYGGLYSWDEMMQYSVSPQTQGICMTGWHIPSDQELLTLINYVGGIDYAGSALKETGTSHWSSPNTLATNSSGFTGLGTGERTSSGSYNYYNSYSCIWSSLKLDATQAWCVELQYSSAAVFHGIGPRAGGNPVRCIRNNCSGTTLSSPSQSTHSPSFTQITWKWNNVAGAAGYKWNSVNNYSTATDRTTDTTYTETGLTCSTGYTRYVWAYNACGASSATALSQTTLTCEVCGQPVTDTRDGKTYNTVQIGTQCWFAQNLNVGTRIPSSSYASDNGIIEKNCYNNDESNCNTYGGLYIWPELMQYSTVPGVQGICPTNWHVPTDAEWTTMTTYLGGTSAGGALKETGTSHWASPNTGATNSSGFKALPGGMVYYSSFSNLNNNAYFWTSSYAGSSDAFFRTLYYNYPWVDRLMYYQSYGRSVRCLKNN